MAIAVQRTNKLARDRRRVRGELGGLLVWLQRAADHTHQASAMPVSHHELLEASRIVADTIDLLALLEVDE